MSERKQSADLQAKLSSSVQEKLAAEGERERLELEIQHLSEQLKWHQEQVSSMKEVVSSSQRLELQTAESRLGPMERSKDDDSDQVKELEIRVIKEVTPNLTPSLAHSYRANEQLERRRHILPLHYNVIILTCVFCL